MKHTELESKLIKIRRHLHQYPELSKEEFETTEYIKKWLRNAEIDIRSTGLPTGVFAEIVGGKPGPTVAIRADIDALPIEEKTGLPYASKMKGVMHACGHDFHTAAAIGAALLLKETQAELNGTVRFIFQPAEESGGGADKVISDGQLDGVDAIIGLHNKPDLPVGTIGLKEGPLMAAVDRFVINLRGKGSHGGLPHTGKDPIVASAQVISALQSIVSRTISPLQSAVISVTRIEGGNTWNVIPEQVTLEGTIRTFDSFIREDVIDKVNHLLEHISAAFTQEATVLWYPGPSPVTNDGDITKIVTESAKKIGLKVVEPEPSMAGEDFASYQLHIPGSFAFFGTSGTEDWHHPAFTVNEDALIKAANYFSESAKNLLVKHSSLSVK
jgi:N-acetylcysteine deacetylase